MSSKKKKNDGKLLEKVVAMIQASQVSGTHTDVRINVKPKTKKGRKRELDVLLTSQVGNHTINIAIECKDYKYRVGATVVEAFFGKCKQYGSINKMIIVSSKGFQAGAYDAAEFHDIQLYTLDELTLEKIKDWYHFTGLTSTTMSMCSSKHHVRVEAGYTGVIDLDSTIVSVSEKWQSTIGDFFDACFSKSLRAMKEDKVLETQIIENNGKRFTIPCNGISLRKDQKLYRLLDISAIVDITIEVESANIKSAAYKNNTTKKTESYSHTAEFSHGTTISIVRNLDSLGFEVYAINPNEITPKLQFGFRPPIDLFKSPEDE